MSSSASLVYRSLEEIIARNRKAIGAPCDISGSRWICGRSFGSGSKNQSVNEEADTKVVPSAKNEEVACLPSASTSAPAPIKLEEKATKKGIASFFKAPAVKTAVEKEVVASSPSASTSVHSEVTSDSEVKIDSQTPLTTAAKVEINATALNSPKRSIKRVVKAVRAIEEKVPRSPSTPKTRPAKRPNAGQHSMDRFLQKKMKDETSFKPQPMNAIAPCPVMPFQSTPFVDTRPFTPIPTPLTVTQQRPLPPTPFIATRPQETLHWSQVPEEEMVAAFIRQNAIPGIFAWPTSV